MIINGIDTTDISVVVQGAIAGEITKLCLESIRTYLPGAEIILSTWEGSCTRGLEYDKLLLNSDPGSFDYQNCEYPIKCNVNRQLYSTLQGLKQVCRPYAVKIRTDFVLQSASFLQWFGRFTARDKTYSYFREKIICCDVYSRNPRRSGANNCFALHPADFFFFGYTADLADLFDIPEVPHEDQIYFSKKYRDKVVLDLPRFTPEQWLWVEFLKKHISDHSQLPEDCADISEKTILLTEKTFAANLVLLSKEQIGLKSGKPNVYTHEPENCFSHKDWRALYEYYCKGNPFPYLLYRWKVAAKNHVFTAKNSVLHQGGRAIACLKQRIAPHLTQKQKDWLKPRYKKLKSSLFPEHFKGYVESFYQEEVTDDNLSVVVQGSISAFTRQTLKSVRRILPRAELILSTWEGMVTDGLDFDKLVLSRDPGSNGLIRRYPHEQANNTNRIIVSSYQGVHSATRRYCLKMRSDMRLESDAFLACYNKYSKFISPQSPFARRVMVEGLSTEEMLVFAVSDWYFMGLTADIEKLFSVPPYEEETTPYFESEEHRQEKKYLEDTVCRYIPAQYVIYQFLKKNIKPMPEWENGFAQNPDHEELYRQFISGSLLCVDFPTSGIVLPKARNRNNPSNNAFAYSLRKWLNLCERYHTLPVSYSAQGSDGLYKEYTKARRYYDIKNKACIIQNYARFDSVAAFENTNAKICKDDITFVISGKVGLTGSFSTQRCIESVRRFFPTSQVILSTWAGEPVEKLASLCDEVLLLKEPKEKPCKYYCTEDHPAQGVNSINKQQFSVHAGLRRVHTTYAVHLRSDFYLANDNLLPFYQEWCQILNRYDVGYQIFRNRVLTSNYYTRDPRNDNGGYVYQLSDCFQFGLTEDLLKLWDGHQESFASLNYFKSHPRSKYYNPEGFNHRYTAEQYFFLNVIRKAGLQVQIPEYYMDTSSERFVFESEKLFASNVIVGNYLQLGLQSKFRDLNPDDLRFYSLSRIAEEYLYNVDPTNEKCLRYLRDSYTDSEQMPQEEGNSCKRRGFVKRCLRGIYGGIKAVMRAVLPGYRVACGVREQQENHEKVTKEQYSDLLCRLDQLQQTSERQKRA